MSRREMERVAAIMLLLAGIAKFCAAQAGAVGAPGQTLRLTLKQAVQLALKQNPQVMVARLLAMESTRQRDIARSGLLPQASLTGATALEQYNFQSVEHDAKPRAAGPSSGSRRAQRFRRESWICR